MTACTSQSTSRVEIAPKIVQEESNIKVEILGDDPSLGNPDAPITMVEFTDYQCPFCKQFYSSTFKRIKQDYIDTGKIFYVVKEFPLTNIHKNAFRAATAARCAGQEGKYFEMHDRLFDTQDKWASEKAIIPLLNKYAADIDLDTDSFIACMSSVETENIVKESMQEANSIGLTGTPSFVINGNIIKGAHPYNSFKEYFDGILQEMGVESL